MDAVPRFSKASCERIKMRWDETHLNKRLMSASGLSGRGSNVLDRSVLPRIADIAGDNGLGRDGPEAEVLRSQAAAFVFTSAAVAVYVKILTLMVPFATKRPQRPIAWPRGN